MWCESRNVVSNVLPFHRICDRDVKPFPSTVSGTEFASLGTLLGEREAIWGCGAALSQLWNSKLQVQPDNSRARTAMRATRIEGEGLQGLTREERILTSLLRAGDILHPNLPDDIGWATYCPNVFSCPLLAPCCHPGGRGFKS